MKTSRLAARVSAISAAAILAVAAPALAGASPWTELGNGLDLGRFPLAADAAAPAAEVHVLRVDPRLWELTIHGLPRGESVGYTAREWSRREGLVAAINAGMYQTDYRTHSGYLSADGVVLSRGTNGYLSAAAFAPVSAADPPFRLFDLDVEPLPAVLPRYRRVVQNLRLVKRPGENRWAPQGRSWSEAALGEDADGRALLLFCAVPLPLDRLIDRLLALPIGLVAAQHLEGGSQAQLFVAAPGGTVELVGGYGGFFPGSGASGAAVPIPNVIGVRRRDTPPAR